MAESCASEGRSRGSVAWESGWACVVRASVAGLAVAASALATWRQRRRDRLHLMTLDDHLLHDIGISRADVERETFKPFWTP
jgi:uncharacterized protein YjiS (DUF1127 family)